MTGLKNSFKRKTWFLLPLCLLLGVLLLWGYSNLFTRANFPYTQPGTYWTDEDGILSVQAIPLSGLCLLERDTVRRRVWDQSARTAAPQPAGFRRFNGQGFCVVVSHAEQAWAPADLCRRRSYGRIPTYRWENKTHPPPRQLTKKEGRSPFLFC